MADFEAAYKVVMRNEGGYANNPNDRGGETYKGIARKMHSEWAGWATVDLFRRQPGFPANLADASGLQALVHSFYKNEFWDKLNLDAVERNDIATEIFDTSVNMGVGVAALFLQRVLNVTNKNGKEYPDLVLDGKIGPKTIATLNMHRRPLEVLKAFNCLQGGKYIGICEANPSQEIFFTSWMSRVFEQTAS